MKNVYTVTVSYEEGMMLSALVCLASALIEGTEEEIEVLTRRPFPATLAHSVGHLMITYPKALVQTMQRMQQLVRGLAPEALRRTGIQSEDMPASSGDN